MPFEKRIRAAPAGREKEQFFLDVRRQKAGERVYRLKG
jgi:hypothetical protein